MRTNKTTLTLTMAAALAVAPMIANAQSAAPTDARGGVMAQAPAATPRDGTPGNPPSTATQRTLDGVTGNRTPADGTPGNPPGTAVGRAVDRATAPSTTGTTTAPMSVDSMSLREGRRASQIIGSTVYNENNESIGEVDDLIFQTPGSAPVAVISVGGFLGIGAKLVALPYERLTHNAERNRWVLQGATKESLQSLPSFAYDSATRRG